MGQEATPRRRFIYVSSHGSLHPKTPFVVMCPTVLAVSVIQGASIASVVASVMSKSP